MKRRDILISFALLAVLWLAVAGYVSSTAPQLPERVATHFGVSGEPNGWMTQSEYVRFTLMIGIGASLFVVGIFAFIRRCGGWGLNIPRKDYWLAPERRERTFDTIQRSGFWLAALLVVFIGGVHHAIVAANAHAPAGLPASDLGGLVGGFLIAITVWIACFFIRFFRRS